MDKKNIIVFARPRSGTTSFSKIIYTNKKTPKFKEHDMEKVHMGTFAYELLNVYNVLIPKTKKFDIDSGNKFDLVMEEVYKRKWLDPFESSKYNENLYRIIIKNDHNKLNEFYQKNILPNDNFYFYEYYVKNKKIRCSLKQWHEKKKFEPNYFNMAQEHQLNLIDEDLDPYFFKYFDNQIGYDTWIDRKNTIVIVIVRNNILARLASHHRVRIANSAGLAHPSRILPSQKQIYIDRSKLTNKLLNIKHIETEIKEQEKFINRVQLLDPDVIISYETLVKHGILNISGDKKVNIDPIAIFFENFVKAEEMVKDVKLVTNKNIALLKDILGISNG